MERQNRTLVSMLRVYCSRYMTDWDRYLPQVTGAYNSTQHSTNGVSPHMRVMKTYLKARYRLSDLLRAQRIDRMERQNRTFSVDAEGIFFQVHDRLGQISSTGDGSLQ